MPITQEDLAALRNARQYAQACADALYECTQPGTPAVLSYSVFGLLEQARTLRRAINELGAAAEEDAGIGGQQ